MAIFTGDVGCFSHAKVARGHHEMEHVSLMDPDGPCSQLRSTCAFLAFEKYFFLKSFPSHNRGKIRGFPGSTPNFQVSFSTETHVPLNRDERATIWTIRNLMAAWSPTLWLQIANSPVDHSPFNLPGEDMPRTLFWGLTWNAPCTGHHYIV